MMEQRRHRFDGLHNFRDFGGYMAGDRRLATGRLFRSANHAAASDADLVRLEDMGIGAVIDLRRPSERERQPSRRWAGFDGVVIQNDDHDEGAETWDVFMSTWDMTQESFRGYMDRYYARAPFTPRLVELYRRYFDVLATQEGGVIVHCAAGKDRTGLIVALTHKLAGVHHDDVVADYMLTNDPERFEAFGAVWAEGIRAERGFGPTMETMRMVMGVEPAYLERSLGVIEEHSGSIDRYICDVLGVDASKRAAIEKKLFG
jgi:protein tyrosine/serine phosphatase